MLWSKIHRIFVCNPGFYVVRSLISEKWIAPLWFLILTWFAFVRVSSVYEHSYFVCLFVCFVCFFGAAASCPLQLRRLLALDTGQVAVVEWRRNEDVTVPCLGVYSQQRDPQHSITVVTPHQNIGVYPSANCGSSGSLIYVSWIKKFVLRIASLVTAA